MNTPTGTPKHVAKVTVEAPIVSFRYPHFLIGRQPTFDMPPPSTIFGHIASALGEWPTTPISFAYHFRSQSRGADLEHQHIVTRTSGKLPGNVPDPLWRPPEPKPGKKLTKRELQPQFLEKTTSATVQPHTRDFLFDVRLELYLDPPSLADAFQSPVFTVVLGRSQDLACVTKVEQVELAPAEQGYVERTILPGELRRMLPWGVTVLMPKYIGPAPERQPVFAPYIVVQDRVYYGAEPGGTSRSFIRVEGEPVQWYGDPTTIEERHGPRLLWFHRIDPNQPNA